MKKKKTIIAIVLLGVLGIIGATFAYFSTTDTFENLFHTDIYKLESYEVFESPDDWKPGDTTPKTFSTKNVGNFDVALRVSFEEEWRDANRNTLSNLDNSNNSLTTINLDDNYPMNWFKKSENGKTYYYYRTVLHKNDSIESLLSSITFNKDISSTQTSDCYEDKITHNQSCRSSASPYAGGKYYLTIKIETIQYDKYRSVWNTDVNISDDINYNLASFISASVGTGELVNDDPDQNVRYIGLNPNNYVQFNNELWRMVGVFDGRVKLVRDEALGYYSWDTSSDDVNYGYGINEWSQAKLMQELNGDYLNNSLSSNTQWYNGYRNNRTAVFDHSKVLKADAQNLIDDAVWYLGANNIDTDNNSPITSDYYDSYLMTAPIIYSNERGTLTGKMCLSGDYCNDNVERTTSWTGKVGLIYMSDVMYATAGGSRTRSSCLNTKAYYFNDYCQNDWLFKSAVLMSPAADSSSAYKVTQVYNSGFFSRSSASSEDHIYPSVYLKSNVKVDGGSGTKTAPYRISLGD